MPQKSLEKLDSAPQLETGLETACTSRRGLFKGSCRSAKLDVRRA